ncbi:MAG: hypothetical protein IJC70_02080 [Firmicutes bacterium]|nr:hypothetical protein [Bacillota bacterium]
MSKDISTIHVPADQEGPAELQIEQETLDALKRLADYLERMNYADYVMLTQKPRKLLVSGFLYGVARGLGYAVGFTIIGALLIWLINQLNVLNLPVIGDFIAELLVYIQDVQSM